MKIVVIGPSYPFKGGISHFNTLLCKALSKKHSVLLIDYTRRYPSILHPGETQIDKSRKKIMFNGEKILDMINPLSWIRASNVIKQFKPDITVIYWYSPLLSPLLASITFMIKRDIKTKIVAICHNIIPPEKRIFDNFLKKFFFRYVDYCVTATKNDYRLMKKEYPQKKILINPHPNYDVFDYRKFDKYSARKKLDIKGKTILTFGYMRKYKGLSTLLKAMPIVLEKQDVTLLIVGEFWGDLKRYKELARELRITKNIHFVSRYVNNEEVELFFKASDLIIVPYISHTNSGVIQLAFSFKKPVIATDVGGFSEVVINNKTGYIVPPKNPKKIAEAIVKFYDNKKEKTFIKNIIKNKKRFSWDAIVKTIEKLGTDY